MRIATPLLATACIMAASLAAAPDDAPAVEFKEVKLPALPNYISFRASFGDDSDHLEVGGVVAEEGLLTKDLELRRVSLRDGAGEVLTRWRSRNGSLIRDRIRRSGPIRVGAKYLLPRTAEDKKVVELVDGEKVEQRIDADPSFPVDGITQSPSNRYLAITAHVSTDREPFGEKWRLLLYDLREQRVRFSHQVEIGKIYAVAFNRNDEKLVVVGSGPGYFASAYVFRFVDGRKLFEKSRPLAAETHFWAVAVSQTEDLALVAGGDGAVYRFPLAENAELVQFFKPPYHEGDERASAKRSQGVSALALSRDGSLLAVGVGGFDLNRRGNWGGVRVFDGKTGK